MPLPAVVQGVVDIILFVTLRVKSYAYDPIADWVLNWVDFWISTGEESTKSVLRECFAVVVRSLNGLSAWFVSIFVDPSYYRKLRANLTISHPWSSWWDNDVTSTFNAMIERDRSGGTLASASTDAAATQGFPAGLGSMTSWVPWRRRNSAAARDKGARGMKRSASDLFETKAGWAAAAGDKRRGALEDLRLWSEMAVEGLFGVLRVGMGAVRALLLRPSGWGDAGKQGPGTRSHMAPRATPGRRRSKRGTTDGWTTADLITAMGYPLEQHKVLTPDGYIININRIPRKDAQDVVFFLHGIFDTELGWVSSGVTGSQAFAAYDEGFDVWLGSSRCNPPRSHVDRQRMRGGRYYVFTVNELAMYDVGAQLDFLDAVKRRELQHHPRVTQQFGALLADRLSYTLGSTERPTGKGNTRANAVPTTQQHCQVATHSPGPDVAPVNGVAGTDQYSKQHPKMHSNGMQACDTGGVRSGSDAKHTADVQKGESCSAFAAANIHASTSLGTPVRRRGQRHGYTSVAHGDADELNGSDAHARQFEWQVDDPVSNGMPTVPSSGSIQQMFKRVRHDEDADVAYGRPTVFPSHAADAIRHTQHLGSWDDKDVFRAAAVKNERTARREGALLDTAEGGDHEAGTGNAAVSGGSVMGPYITAAGNAWDEGGEELHYPHSNDSSSTVGFETPQSRMSRGDAASVSSSLEHSCPGSPGRGDPAYHSPSGHAFPVHGWHEPGVHKDNPVEPSGTSTAQRSAREDGLGGGHHGQVSGRIRPVSTDDASLSPGSEAWFEAHGGGRAADAHVMAPDLYAQGGMEQDPEQEAAPITGHSSSSVPHTAAVSPQPSGGGDTEDMYHLRAVGHSLGGAVLLTYLVKRRMDGRRHHISRMVLLTPAGFLFENGPLAHFFLFILPPTVRLLSFLLPGRGSPIFLPTRWLRAIVFKLAVDMQHVKALQDLFAAMVSWFLGKDPSEWASALRMPHYNSASMPCISVHAGYHICQWVFSKKFRMFDYGSPAANARAYDGQTEPPDIGGNYHRIDVPVDLVAGKYDGIVAASNVFHHFRRMRDAGVRVTYKEFEMGHLDFVISQKEDLLHYVQSRLLAP